ncbi:unnamed protein product [Urochloa humidicola]
MTPEEIRHESWRTKGQQNPDPQMMEVTVDTFETARDEAAKNLDLYQEETRRWRDKKIRPRGIRTGDMVIRKIPKGPYKGKLNPKWEEPFLVSETTRPSAFRLQTLDGVDDPYPWNEDMLRRYYI